jgi:hypothetical protein
MRSVTGMHGRYDLRSELSSGGVGIIYATDRPDIVYKEYKDAAKAPQRQHLELLVSIGRQVIVEQRIPVGAQPESSINWPLDIVSGPGGAVTGVILPAIPRPLYHEDHNRPRDLQFLILARSNPPAADARVALLLRMAEIFAYIDFRKLVHGDLSYRNLVWTLRPEPVMYLIDCDGMRPQDPPPTEGVQSIGFTDPRVIEGSIPAHDHRSDWYALALAMYRGLLLRPGNLEKRDGRWPKVSNLPPELDARIAALLRQALDHPLDADARPTPAEWVAALRAAYLPNGAWDRKALAALDRVAEKRPQPTPAFTPLPPVSDGRSPTRRPTGRPRPRPRHRPAPPLQPSLGPPYGLPSSSPSPYGPPPPPPPLYGPPPPPPPSSYGLLSSSPSPYGPPPPPPSSYDPPAPPPSLYDPPPSSLIPSGPISLPSPYSPPPPPYRPPSDRQPSALARWAMTKGSRYHATSWAMTCCAWPASLILQIIVLTQLVRTPPYYPRRTWAIVAAAFYLALSALLTLYCGLAWLLDSDSAPSNTADVPPSP